jgi:hypothetical protein
VTRITALPYYLPLEKMLAELVAAAGTGSANSTKRQAGAGQEQRADGLAGFARQRDLAGHAQGQGRCRTVREWMEGRAGAKSAGHARAQRSAHRAFWRAQVSLWLAQTHDGSPSPSPTADSKTRNPRPPTVAKPAQGTPVTCARSPPTPEGHARLPGDHVYGRLGREVKHTKERGPWTQLPFTCWRTLLISAERLRNIKKMARKTRTETPVADES